jgi:hypothetical protein
MNKIQEERAIRMSELYGNALKEELKVTVRLAKINQELDNITSCLKKSRNKITLSEENTECEEEKMPNDIMKLLDSVQRQTLIIIKIASEINNSL